MGILESIDLKLSLICVALGVKVDQAGGLLDKPINEIRDIAAAAAAGSQVPSQTLPVSRLTVVQALAAGNTLTGNEIDEQGCFWDRTINTEKPAVTQKNIWKRGKNIDNEVYDQRVAEIKAQVNAERGATVTVAAAGTAPAVTPGAVSTTPSLPPVAGALPGVPGAGLPPVPGALPGVPGAAAAQNPHRTKVIELTNILTDRYDVAFEAVQQLYIELGSPDGSLPSVPGANLEALASKLNNWTLVLDWVEESQKAILEMNGNDSSFTAIICQQLQVGTTDLAEVAYADIYKVYQGLHQYRNTLEQHWQKPLTAIKTLAV